MFSCRRLPSRKGRLLSPHTIKSTRGRPLHLGIPSSSSASPRALPPVPPPPPPPPHLMLRLQRTLLCRHPIGIKGLEVQLLGGIRAAPALLLGNSLQLQKVVMLVRTMSSLGP